MGFSDEYTAISINDLAVGIEINYSIFYEHQREYFLLCKNIVLTDALMEKFKKITAPSYKIYIPNENYRKMLRSRIMTKSDTTVKKSHVSDKKDHTPDKKDHTPDKKDPVLDSKNAVSFDGYADVKEEMAELFEDFPKTRRVRAEVTDAIVQTVHTQIDTVDVSLIIQSINSVREIDEYLHTHSTNVALLNGLIGKWLRLAPETIDILVKIGLLHDIGKLEIPSEILNKPGKLTKEEFEIIKMHPIYSYRVLSHSGVTDRQLLQGVIQHHEKVNGHGYPHGLLVDNISDLARITAISDVYDAMVAKRAYKEAHSPFEILAWFAKGCYSDLDINYVNTFLDCMTEELKGKFVLLSDSSIAEVLYVHSSNFEFPIVRVGENVIHTTPELHCVAMYNDTPA